jgi:hypothetical protein
MQSRSLLVLQTKILKRKLLKSGRHYYFRKYTFLNFFLAITYTLGTVAHLFHPNNIKSNSEVKYKGYIGASHVRIENDAKKDSPLLHENNAIAKILRV